MYSGPYRAPRGRPREFTARAMKQDEEEARLVQVAARLSTMDKIHEINHTEV